MIELFCTNEITFIIQRRLKIAGTGVPKTGVEENSINSYLSILYNSDNRNWRNK